MFHIRHQNAGLLITGRRDDVLFEAFELLAPNSRVMSCEGSLLRQFPECAATVKRNVVSDGDFLKIFVDTIHRLSTETVPITQQVVQKAGAQVTEVRDTNSPFLVTRMLMDILAGLGESVEPNRLTIRSREHVAWRDARLPFHRSPAWLFLRVALRLVLQRSPCGELGNWYKKVMAFHLSRLLALATSAGIDSDLLFCAGAKVAHRITKLDPPEAPWTLSVKASVQESQKLLQQRWQMTQANDAGILPTNRLADVIFRHDSRLGLVALNTHLHWINSRTVFDQTVAGPGDRSTFRRLSPTDLPALHIYRSPAALEHFQLIEFESWIEFHLQDWLEVFLRDQSLHSTEGTLQEMYELVQTYYQGAFSCYSTAPEALSLMYLCIMELWVAMDKIASARTPLLLSYDPGFSKSLLYPLLLATKSQMRRLHSIEKYLSTRGGPGNSYPSAFGGFGEGNSFAVRYFNSSKPHQALFSSIQTEAARKKKEKKGEWEKLRRGHQELISRKGPLSECDYVDTGTSIQHSHLCQKCRLEREIKALTIGIFEEPLPNDINQAKAVVFEISVPEDVRLWRDTTMFLLVDVFSAQWEKTSGRHYHAFEHSGLRPSVSSTSRLHPASSNKPFEVAHYKVIHISEAKLDNVCLPHGSQYAYQDTERNSRCPITQKAEVSNACSYSKLSPEGVMRGWIRYADHDSNKVISSQSRCPRNLSLEEFRAFGHLRAGIRVQWANVLTQLLLPSLDLNKDATYGLFVQACLQVGPPSQDHSVLREAHIDAGESVFAVRFTRALREALERIRQSWQNDSALCLFTRLATRLLSLTDAPEVASSVLEYLSEIRNVSSIWAQELLQKLNESDSDSDRDSWAHRLLKVSLICVSTFDIGCANLESVLSHPLPLATLVQSSIMIRDNLPGNEAVSEEVARQLLFLWRKVMHESHSILIAEILQHQNSGLDTAIQTLWDNYTRDPAGWISRGHILESSSHGLPVTFNLLTGSLLINGSPLTRLPERYRSHPTYLRLFGKRMLNVIPSRLPGMLYSSYRDQKGWGVHFAMADKKLIIQSLYRPYTDQAVRQRDPETGSDIWEYIDPEDLGRDLPSTFVNRFSHWINLRTRVVVFRPVDDPWKQSPDWILDIPKSLLQKGPYMLIDPHSQTARTIHKCLAAFESAEDINLILQPDMKTVVAELPLFALSFWITEGETAIKSKDYVGMKIDRSQGIGTLVGLKNKLVLRPESRVSSKHRIILVPRALIQQGEASILTARENGHVRVNIEAQTSDRKRHDAFEVDITLGRLKDSGGLQSKLFLCLLHALTSHCVPDPMTGRTGTEEALTILRSPAVKSFQHIDEDSHNLLLQIAQLTPKREYYPRHLKDMESVAWDESLPPLSQHEEFRTEATSIIDDAVAYEDVFKPDTTAAGILRKLEKLPNGGDELTNRARIRNSVFRTSGFGAEASSNKTSKSIKYRGRCLPAHLELRHIHNVVRCLDNGLTSGQCLEKPTSALSKAIRKVNGNKFSFGDNTAGIGLSFHPGQFSVAYPVGNWSFLHQILARPSDNKYAVMFFLARLLSAGVRWDFVHALMLLANTSDFKSTISPPYGPTFDLDINRETLPRLVGSIVDRLSKARTESPEQNLGRRPDESFRDFDRRRDSVWKNKLRVIKDDFLAALKRQYSNSWNVGTPQTSTNSPFDRYLKVSEIMVKVRAVVDQAHRSEKFIDYLDRVVARMAAAPSMSPGGPPRRPILDEPFNDPPASVTGFIDRCSLFKHPAPSAVPSNPDPCPHPQTAIDAPEESHASLHQLIDDISQLEGPQRFQHSYIQELRRSADSFTTAQVPALKVDADPGLLALNAEHLQKQTNGIRRNIKESLSGNSIASQISSAAGVYPRISPAFLLEQLSRARWPHLPQDWKKELVNHAVAMAYMNRAQRLLEYSQDPARSSELQKDLQNIGCHDVRNPLEHPETLLLEVEQGILVRPVQHDVASKMREPPNGKNAVMQLNMGEGKSSVIVPLIASELADGDRLVRVVVAKPQSKQMAHMLITKLGGLINRRIFYLPFSRSVKLSLHQIEIVRSIIETCRKEGGILLVQPEHLLSFKLMGIEKSSEHPKNASNSLGSQVVELYKDFETMSRDIVDESDENFSVKFELIYTMGDQQSVEMSPDRWVVIQELMNVVLEVARDLAEEMGSIAEGIQIKESDKGRFPIVRILEATVGQRLVKMVGERVCKTGLLGFPIHHQPEDMRKAVLSYITESHPSPEAVSQVETVDTGLFVDPGTRKGLLLLRGLLAKGVILFALSQKRWRVNYGLALDRHPQTGLAVPYRAKDMPSPRSEFSHPEVIIVLTCLSYYYRGLSDAELFTCLELLRKSDQANQEFGLWALGAPSLDSSFKHFSSINLKDKTQCEKQIFPFLRYSKPAIDFYLSRIIFAKEMKQFPSKLSASGWDLAKEKQHPLTGFSGTNDSKIVLPLAVEALDLPRQRHTNAAVLSCLLRSENNVMELGSHSPEPTVPTADTLLGAVVGSQQPMRVILDVGAQIIELSNLELARRWLELAPVDEIDAAIFFDDNDDLSVMTRGGAVDAFLTSPFATHTDRCLVFLDQAHTRGTDLRLPDSYRAAVTLGPGVTKDTLVQGLSPIAFIDISGR